MTTICSFLQNFQGREIVPMYFWNHTVFLDSHASVSELNKITYGYIAPVIIGIGVIGDVLTIITLTHPLLRRASIIYTYLTLLAFTDLLTHISIMPMLAWLLDFRLCSATFSFYYAHIGFPLANALMGASVWIVVFLTLSQYMAVCQPFHQGYLRKRKMCFVLFGLAYLFSFCVYAPWAMKKGVHKIPGGLLKCSYVICDRQIESWFWVYEWMREFLTRILPFVLIAYFNTMILITYRNTKRDRNRLASTRKPTAYERSEQEEKRLFKLLFGVIIVFFVSTIPAAPLTVLVADRRSQNMAFQIFRAVTNLLELTKFALNFYFYCLINPDIRRICFQVIQCQKFVRPARVKGQNVNPISIYTRSTKSTVRGTPIPGATPRNGSSRRSSRCPNDPLRRSSMLSNRSTRSVRSAQLNPSCKRPRYGSAMLLDAAGPEKQNLLRAHSYNNSTSNSLHNSSLALNKMEDENFNDIVVPVRDNELSVIQESEYSSVSIATPLLIVDSV
ncbi:7 transmembrane receptor (rhodopsin family) domain-containing protein [Ditylenchus destructor]|uniref:7 transmembrane receptor (Rhodopsin family) domain-containing protein n=1 Tax=Ditylenchus destructor TaxID=166010 RepID=A0AAD4MTJ5_9BILA|nr:7 transmembrane receptor (rhodopsin family) domain-containing protein [Ditylenchus destructor]